MACMRAQGKVDARSDKRAVTPRRTTSNDLGVVHIAVFDQESANMAVINNFFTSSWPHGRRCSNFVARPAQELGESRHNRVRGASHVEIADGSNK